MTITGRLHPFSPHCATCPVSLCRAFSAAGAVESAYAIASNSLVSLSESQLVDCATENGGCNGGWMTTAFSYIINAGGIAPTSVYAYTPSQSSCRFDASTAAVVLTGYTDVAAGDETALLQVRCRIALLRRHGTVA